MCAQSIESWIDEAGIGWIAAGVQAVGQCGISVLYFNEEAKG